MNAINIVSNTYKQFLKKPVAYLILLLPLILVFFLIDTYLPSILSTLFLFIITPLVHLEIYDSIKRDENPKLSNIFNFASAKLYSIELLKFIFTFLWFLLLIIPGLIKILSYERTSYLYYHDRTLPASDYIKFSMQEMKGHKWTAFLGSLLITIPSLIYNIFFADYELNSLYEVLESGVTSNLNTIDPYIIIYFIATIITMFFMFIYKPVFHDELDKEFNREKEEFYNESAVW